MSGGSAPLTCGTVGFVAGFACGFAVDLALLDFAGALLDVSALGVWVLGAWACAETGAAIHPMSDSAVTGASIRNIMKNLFDRASRQSAARPCRKRESAMIARTLH